MKVRRLFVGVAGLAAAASMIGLGAGAALADQAADSQHAAVGNIDLRISTDGITYGRTAEFVANENVSGYGTDLVTKTVYLKNVGSMAMKTTAKVTTSGDLPVVLYPVRVSTGAELGTGSVTIGSLESASVTFAYRVPHLANDNQGRSALITLTARGEGLTGPGQPVLAATGAAGMSGQLVVGVAAVALGIAMVLLVRRASRS